MLEGLETEAGSARGGRELEEDRFIGYPVKLERWLMEGSYDRVWKAVGGGAGVPAEEFGVFSEVSGERGSILRFHPCMCVRARASLIAAIREVDSC